VFAHSTASTGTKTIYKFSSCCATNCKEIAGRAARFRIQFCRDKLLYERPITIYEQLRPDKLFTYILLLELGELQTPYRNSSKLMSPLFLQIKPRLQALCQHNRSTFPFVYHIVPTALAANSSKEQSHSCEANFCSVTFQNVTVVNIRTISSLRCKAVQFG
jgi:hypothetical protein